MDRLKEYISSISLLDNLETEFKKVKEQILLAKRVIFLGCGGSMSTCGHMAHDFLKVGRIPTICPQSSSLLTCLFNDYPKQDVFKQWLEIQATDGDMLIVISSSGTSAVTINAANYFKKFGEVVTFTAMNENNKLRSCGDTNIYFNTNSFGIHEIYSEIFLHAILDEIVDEQLYT